MPLRRSSSRLRALLREPGLLAVPAVFNALSARIACIAGYQAVWLSNSALCASLVAEPDPSLLTASEVAMAAGYIADAVDAPVLVDAEAGFGNAINAMRTTRQLIMVGSAGMFLSDRIAAPGLDPALAPPASLDEAVGKVRAAAHVRDDLDPDFLIVVRAQTANDPGDSVADRMHAYLSAGADVVLPSGKLAARLVPAFRADPSVPTWWDAGPSPDVTTRLLEEMGVRAVLTGHASMAVAAAGMLEYFRDFRVGDIVVEKRVTDELVGHPLANLHAFVGFPEIRKLEEAYLPRDEVVKKYERSVGLTP